MAEAMAKPDEILKNAVENVLADDGFKIQTPSSRSAVEDARKLIQSVPVPVYICLNRSYLLLLFLFSELMDKDEVSVFRKPSTIFKKRKKSLLEHSLNT